MAESPSILQPEQIAGYDVRAELSAGRTFLADGRGRRVVLKLLESDCLLGEQLHPMIHDRLSRVRELAHAGVANLLGVEADGEQAYLVWEHVEGAPLREVVSTFDDRRRDAVARELVSHVETLHALGIVHGALHARNVIVMPTGKVKLTHVSPLLYNDEAVDVEAVTVLLEQMRNDASNQDGSAPPKAGGLQSQGFPVIRALCASRPIKDDDSTSASRRSSLIAAVLIAMAGAGIAWGVWHWTNKLSDDDTAAPLAPRTTVERGVAS
jgi:serine/threonine protein kinase